MEYLYGRAMQLLASLRHRELIYLGARFGERDI